MLFVVSVQCKEGSSSYVVPRGSTAYAYTYDVENIMQVCVLVSKVIKGFVWMKYSSYFEVLSLNLAWGWGTS